MQTITLDPRRMRAIFLAPLFLALPATAQEPPAPEQPEQREDNGTIIVTSPDKPKKSVQSTSRIPREPLFTDLTYRSNTGLSGATSGNGGFEPFNLSNPIAKKKIRDCKADREGLGKAATCLMGSAGKAMESGDIEGGHDMLRHISTAEEFSAEEKLAASELLYASALETQDVRLREEALVRMLASTAMQEEAAQSARRTLVAMALRDERDMLAVERLERVVHHDPADAQSLANLAILSRKLGRSDARSTMLKAIAAAEASGGTAPKAWRQFAAQQP